jgi:glucose/arabinose dehydrogenase
MSGALSIKPNKAANKRIFMTMRTPMICLAAAGCCLAAAQSMAIAEGTRGGVEELTTVRVASGMTRPIFVTHAPDDDNRLYIIEKRGVIKVLNRKTGDLQSTAEAFLNIDSLVGGGQSNGDERGLLGLAFHPDFANNGYFYVNYTDNANDTVVARYSITDRDTADPGSAETVLEVDQPFSNHNGGWMAFGPGDGYLYISLGDGGAGGDPGNRAQDITNQLLGKMLRIDVDDDDFPADPNRNYAIPANNPFVGVTGDDEIWAYGLRNAWRNSFDRLTGDFYIADVGQGAWEEVNFQSFESGGGENYGWRCYEGSNPYNLTGCPPPDTMVFPIHEYSHGGSPFRCSITGGYVYRGCAIPSLDGTYFFSDYCSEQIWTFRYDGENLTEFTDRTSELDPPNYSIGDIVSYGEDLRGELYIVDQNGSSSGEIFKIVPVNPTLQEADLNCDGVVDVDDLLILLSQWGDEEAGQLADFDGDFNVDVDELLDLLAQWG